MVNIQLSEYGSVLATRQVGKIIADRILLAIDNQEFVSIDMLGVEIVTLSFADELLSNIIASIGIESFRRNSTFRNTNKIVTKVLLKALDVSQKNPIGFAL